MPQTNAPPRPQNPQAEEAILGALLLDPQRIIDVAPLLKAEDFHDPTYRTIYQAMSRLYEARKPIDFITVAEELKGEQKVQERGGPVFLAEICGRVATSSHADHYAAIVRDKALHRQLQDVGFRIQGLGTDEKLPALEALEQAERELLAISRHVADSRPRHIADVAAESYEHYAQLQQAEDKAALFGLTTGFGSLDAVLTGLPSGSLTIVAARPSTGKSAFALDIARHAAATLGKSVAVFSLEMTKQEIMDRIIAGSLGVEAWKLKKGELTEADFARMGTFFDQLKQHPIYLDDDPDTTIGNLRSKARRQQMEHGLDLLVIDYLQLIEVTDRAAGENRTQQVSHISRSLKNLARELGCPIIALSQLSRSTEQRNPPIPILSDLRESGGIEQDADVVLMLYREEMYNEDCQSPGGTDIYIRKNRHGPTGRVELFFDKAKMSFREPAPQYEPESRRRSGGN
jgi:replicative DNA helicase